MKILITETNVDGCGDYAQTMVEFPETLTPEDQALLKQTLADVKTAAGKTDTCLDTDDMVNQALLEFGHGGKIVAVADTFLTF